MGKAGEGAELENGQSWRKGRAEKRAELLDAFWFGKHSSSEKSIYFM